MLPTRRSANILSASGRSPQRFTIEASIRRLFALRAQADRMSALPLRLLNSQAIGNSGFLLSGSKFLAQLLRRVFAQLLLDPLVFQCQRDMPAALIQTLQHVISFGPARTASGGGFDHL
jgi:hypothetical protein